MIRYQYPVESPYVLARIKGSHKIDLFENCISNNSIVDI